MNKRKSLTIQLENITGERNTDHKFEYITMSATSAFEKEKGGEL